MNEYTYWSPLAELPMQCLLLVGTLTLLGGMLFLTARDARTLGWLLLSVTGMTGLMIWFGLEGYADHYRVESQVTAKKALGPLTSVTRSTRQSFLIQVDGRQRVLEGSSGDLQAGENMMEELRGNGGIAVCRTTQGALPRCWWQIVAPLGREQPLE